MKKKAIEIVEKLEVEKYPVSHDKFKIGDTIRVEYLRINIKDITKKDKFLFEGIAIAINKKSKMLRVLKEDKDKSLTIKAIFPLNSPDVSIRLLSSSKRRQRRSKAYYLEELTGKKATMKIIK